MAKFTVDGLDEYINCLNQIQACSSEIWGKSIYAGAKIVADAIRANLEDLPAAEDLIGVIAYVRKGRAPLTETPKQGLLDGLGISKMETSMGYYHVKIGFDGYNQIKTKAYPKGQPNIMVARAVENGSSISKRRPFIKPAIRDTREAMEQEMADVINEEIEKLMK